MGATSTIGMTPIVSLTVPPPAVVASSLEPPEPHPAASTVDRTVRRTRASLRDMGGPPENGDGAMWRRLHTLSTRVKPISTALSVPTKPGETLLTTLLTL